MLTPKLTQTLDGECQRWCETVNTIPRSPWFPIHLEKEWRSCVNIANSLQGRFLCPSARLLTPGIIVFRLYVSPTVVCLSAFSTSDITINLLYIDHVILAPAMEARRYNSSQISYEINSLVLNQVPANIISLHTTHQPCIIINGMIHVYYRLVQIHMHMTQ